MNTEKKCQGLATTCRFDAGTAAKLAKMSHETGASQSEVIRTLVAASLSNKAKLQITQHFELSTDDKKLMFDIMNLLSSIIFELNKIGNNINVKRKKYNTNRKIITDKIEMLRKMSSNTDTYSRIKYEDQIKKLQNELNEYDSIETSFVSDSEWKEFNKILEGFRQVSQIIGRDLNGYIDQSIKERQSIN